MKPFSERLRDAMDGADVKAKALSIRSGVSQRYINALLTGENEIPRIDKALLIARALDVSLDWLVTGERWRIEELTPDEDALVASYRAIKDDEAKALVRDVARDAAKLSH